MNFSPNGQPFLVLVDDDSHSARLMVRTLLANGSPAVTWIDDADSAIDRLVATLADRHATEPGMVIVDLKASSTDTADFIARLRAVPGGRTLLVAAMAATLERHTRDDLLLAGADGVFERHGDVGTYRNEANAIVSFWARNRRLDAVGT